MELAQILTVKIAKQTVAVSNPFEDLYRRSQGGLETFFFNNPVVSCRVGIL